MSASKQSLLVSAKTVAGLIDNEIATHTAIASTLANSRALQTNDLETFWQEAKKSLEFVPGAWIAVTNPDGSMILNTLAPFGASLPNHPEPETLKRAFATGEPQVGNLVFGPVSQRFTGFVQVPVFRDNAPLYSLSISLSPDRFHKLIVTRFTNNEFIGILDRRHKFITRIPDHQLRLGTSASDGWRAAINSAPEGFSENKTVEGMWSLNAYTQTMHGWTVGVGLLEAAIQNPLKNILRSSLIIACIFTAIALLVALIIARNTHRGMTALAAAAGALGRSHSIPTFSPPFEEADAFGKRFQMLRLSLKRGMTSWLI